MASRIVCSPHHGARAGDANANAIRIVRDELVRAIRGEPLQNVVNPDTLTYGTDDSVDLDRYDISAYQT